MLRAERRIGIVVLLFVIAEPWAGGFTPLRGPATVRAADQPRSTSPTDYTWTLEYKVWTKPGGERGQQAKNPGVTTDVSFHCVAVVRDIHVRPDGTFSFDHCDFGLISSTTRNEYQLDNGRSFADKSPAISNWQVLLRGSGKFAGGGRSLREPVTLDLEWAPGPGSTRGTDGSGAPTLQKSEVSPDLTTMFLDSDGLHSASPVQFHRPALWKLEPPESADNNGEATQTRRLRVLPVSFAESSPNNCDCENKKLGDQRKTEFDICGFKMSAQESVELEGRKGDFALYLKVHFSDQEYLGTSRELSSFDPKAIPIIGVTIGNGTLSECPSTPAWLVVDLASRGTAIELESEKTKLQLKDGAVLGTIGYKLRQEFLVPSLPPGQETTTYLTVRAHPPQSLSAITVTAKVTYTRCDGRPGGDSGSGVLTFK